MQHSWKLTERNRRSMTLSISRYRIAAQPEDFLDNLMTSWMIYMGRPKAALTCERDYSTSRGAV